MTQMLMEFETLDKDDVYEIINGSWDIAKKKARLKAAEDLQKKVTPPSFAKETGKPSSTIEPQQA